MKKSVWVLAMMVSVAAVAQTEKPFTIKGSFKNIGMPVQKLYLSYRSGDNSVRDSVVPENGRYVFKGKLLEPTIALVRPAYERAADGNPVMMRTGRDFIN